MAAWLPAGLLLLVAALTPGPNNLVVMRTAARSGWVAALHAVAGVVTGGLVLLVVVASGAGRAFVAWPLLRTVVALGGVLYLVWLGARCFIAAGRDDDTGSLPSGMFGLFGFQFFNPKGWVMVLTVVAALPDVGATRTILHLAPLFVCIPTACLLLWAALGSALARHLARRVVRIWTDRALGALLVLAALLLVL